MDAKGGRATSRVRPCKPEPQSAGRGAPAIDGVTPRNSPVQCHSCRRRASSPSWALHLAIATPAPGKATTRTRTLPSSYLPWSMHCMTRHVRHVNYANN